MEIAQKLGENKIWEQTDTEKFYYILERLEMRKKPQERKLNELQVLARNIDELAIYARHDLTKYAINELNKLIAKEIEKEKVEA